MAYTWTNSREQASWARLDRFLISPAILLLFPNLLQKGLPKNVSDHNAITLSESKEDWGPPSFHFYNTWLDNKELMKSAMDGWVKNKAIGSAGWVLFSKLKSVKNRVKCWVASNKKLPNLISKLEGNLEAVDRKASVRGWSEELRKERSCILVNLWKEIRREEQMWK